MTRRIILLLPWLLLGSRSLHAQTTSSESVNWRQLESTYQSELKKIHLPLISAYVEQLKRLAATSRSAETTVAINEELNRIQAVISSGGVIDLTRAASELNNKTAPLAPEPPKAAAGKALLTLVPTIASEILPVPAAGVPLDSVPFQKITWNIEALPRGSYEIVAQCSLQTLEQAASLQLSLDHHQLDFSLLSRHLASSPGDFRLLRLGLLELPLDIEDSPLELLVTPAGASAQIHLRQLFISRSSSEPALKNNSPPSQP